MGKANFKLPGQRGIINFLPLVVVAVLLIGFVGYFSVNRLKTNAKETVLGESNTQLASTETDLEGQLEADSQGLDDVGEIDETVSAGVEFKSDSTTQDYETKEGSTSPEPVMAGTEATLKVNNYKLFGVVNVKLSDDSFFLRYLSFLFTK